MIYALIPISFEIKKGNMSDFFASVKETARKIDEGKKVIRKNTVWIESKDLMGYPMFRLST